jgi:hypothetical protein
MANILKKRPPREAHSTHQNFLYNRALYGLSIYTPEEVVIMPPEKRKRILQIHKKTQKILNLWKQEIVNILANKIFTDIFPDTEITNCLVKVFGIDGDPEYVNNMSFKTLKISKEQIVTKLIECKVLPKNFNELNQKEDHASRISSKRRPDPGVKPREHTGGRALEISSQAG